MVNLAISKRASATSQSVGYLIWRLVNKWQKKQKAALEPHNITPVQLLLLAGLAELSASSKEIKQSDLATYCRTDPMMTSQIIRSLEKRRLLKRGKHEKDGRAIKLSPTEKGQQMVLAALPVMLETDRFFFAGLGDRTNEFADAVNMLSGERPRRRVPAA